MRYAIIAGNGTTSRNNVEALIEDFLYVPDKEVTILMPYRVRLSDGQIYAQQYATEAGFSVVTLSDNENLNPYRVAVETPQSVPASGLLLWDDDDQDCLELLSLMKEKGIKAFDLCQGLLEINPSENLEVFVPVEPPKQEAIEEPAEEEDEEAEELEDEEDTGLTDADTLYDAVQLIADIFADAIASRIVEALKGLK